MFLNIIKVITTIFTLCLLIVVFLDKSWLNYDLTINRITYHKQNQIVFYNNQKNNKAKRLSHAVEKSLRTTYAIYDGTAPLNTKKDISTTSYLSYSLNDKTIIRILNRDLRVTQIVVPLKGKYSGLMAIGTNDKYIWCKVQPWRFWLMKRELNAPK